VDFLSNGAFGSVLLDFKIIAKSQNVFTGLVPVLEIRATAFGTGPGDFDLIGAIAGL
jgi:hypothetical protein